MTTQAEIFSDKLDQKYDGEAFESLIGEMGADIRYYTSRGSEDGELTEQNSSDHVDGDVILYTFDDDSMIVLAGPSWDIYDGIELPEIFYNITVGNKK